MPVGTPPVTGRTQTTTRADVLSKSGPRPWSLACRLGLVNSVKLLNDLAPSLCEFHPCKGHPRPVQGSSCPHAFSRHGPVPLTWTSARSRAYEGGSAAGNLPGSRLATSRRPSSSDLHQETSSELTPGEAWERKRGRISEEETMLPGASTPSETWGGDTQAPLSLVIKAQHQAHQTPR